MARQSLDLDGKAAVANRIRQIRGEQKQADFAVRLGVSRAALASYESGRRLPLPEVLRRLAQISGRSVEELKFGVKSRTSAPGSKRRETLRVPAEPDDPRSRDPIYTGNVKALSARALTDDELFLVAVARLAAVNGAHRGSLCALVEAATKNVCAGVSRSVRPEDLFALHQLQARLAQGERSARKRADERHPNL